MVKEEKGGSVVFKRPDGAAVSFSGPEKSCFIFPPSPSPSLYSSYGWRLKCVFFLVWRQGNTGRQVTKDLMAKLPTAKTNKRGITVDGSLILLSPRASF